MKIISVFVMFVLFGVFADAQDAPKVLAEIAASSEGTVKNSPFSAEAVSESVQTLADGNRIVRNSTSKLYRNSEGRFRREMTSGSGGMLGPMFTYGPGVTLLDPVGGFRYTIDPNLKTTHQMLIRPRSEIKIVTGVTPITTVEGSGLSEKVRSEIKAAVEARVSGQNNVVVSEKVREEIRAAVVAPAAIARTVVGQMAEAPSFSMSYAYGSGSQSKWDKRTEELGTQNIEGVDAEGTRTITSIPAGEIGNERPIEITYEKWYSRDLQLVVMSKHNDPRYGEQTYRLTNIVRSEPDPSLFTLPNGYKLVTEPSGTYTVSPTAVRAAAAERAVTAGQAQKPATATKTKP
ncbi:MAG: hypothetical protein ABI481_05365 [Pyrinomonadaceae bacterium]